MTDKIEIGDVVVLKSGGPKMVVVYKTSKKEEEFACRWFNSDHSETHKAIFLKACLTKKNN